jgi:hypothetical protein
MDVERKAWGAPSPRAPTSKQSSSRGARSISGVACSASAAQWRDEKSRNQTPGRHRPARPRRGMPLAREYQVVRRVGTREEAEMEVILVRPVSTTKTTSSTRRKRGEEAKGVCVGKGLGREGRQDKTCVRVCAEGGDERGGGDGGHFGATRVDNEDNIFDWERGEGWTWRGEGWTCVRVCAERAQGRERRRRRRSFWCDQHPRRQHVLS